MLIDHIKRCLELVMTYICAILVLAAGLAACLLRGFYFTEEMYAFLIVWFVLCSLVAIYVLITQGWGKNRIVGGQRIIEQRNREIRVTCIMLSCPFVILFLYLITWLRGPLSGQETMNEVLRWGFYASFLLLVYYSASNRRGAQILTVSWTIVGMTLSCSGLLTICGLLKLPFALAYSNTTEVSVTGARLGGLLEYPNTFGAVMAVFLVERLFAVATYYARTDTYSKGTKGGESGNVTGIWSGSGTEAERSEAGKAGKASEVRSGSGTEAERGEAGTAAALLRLLPLFPYAAALLLSESRGAWLAAACACAAALTWKRQLIAPLLVAGAAPVAAAALLYRQLARAGLAVEPLPGLLMLAGLWAGALLAGLWLCRREHSAAGRTRAAMLALAAVGWTAAGTAVLLYVHERITGPSSTVSARGLLYRDAWRLAAEAPWLGRGGETWQSSYLAIQSHPYVGSQVHNGYLDILLNLGIVGLATLLLMLLAVGYLLVTTSPRLLPPFLVIILHSAVDFDWSYGIVWLLLFSLPALAIAARPPKAALPATANPPTACPMSNPQTTHHQSSVVDGRYAHVRFYKKQWFIAAACSMYLILALMSLHAQQGSLLYQRALQTSEPAEQETLLLQSLAWNPLPPRTAITLARILPAAQSVRVLHRSLLYSPENTRLSWEMAERLMSNHSGASLYWVRRSMRLDVYNAIKRVKAIEGMLAMSQRKIAEGNYTEGLKYAVTGEELLHQYRLLADREDSKGKRYNDRQFEINEQAADLLSRRLREMKLAANHIEGEARTLSHLSTKVAY